jgi:hypothetical protein
MIDLEIKRRFDPFADGHYYEPFYVCRDSGARYRRILGGLAWPGVNPGFAVIVAENFAKDHALDVHHLRVLDETEEPRIEDLINWCGMIEANCRNVSWCWYTCLNNRPAMEFVYPFWEKLKETGRDGFSLVNAPYAEDQRGFEFCVNMLKKHLVKDRKSLHLGEKSKLPGYLMNLQMMDLRKEQAEDYPAIAALGYAVATLASWPTAGLPQRR